MLKIFIYKKTSKQKLIKEKNELKIQEKER